MAPPVHYPGFASMPSFPVPVTVFQGQDDEVVAAAAVAGWCASRQLPSQAFATGHFFHGLLPELKAATGVWIRDAFPGAGPAGKLPPP